MKIMSWLSIQLMWCEKEKFEKKMCETFHLNCVKSAKAFRTTLNGFRFAYNIKEPTEVNMCENRWIISNYKENEKIKFATIPVLMRSHAISS